MGCGSSKGRRAESDVVACTPEEQSDVFERSRTPSPHPVPTKSECRFEKPSSPEVNISSPTPRGADVPDSYSKFEVSMMVNPPTPAPAVVLPNAVLSHDLETETSSSDPTTPQSEPSTPKRNRPPMLINLPVQGSSSGDNTPVGTPGNVATESPRLMYTPRCKVSCLSGCHGVAGGEYRRRRSRSITVIETHKVEKGYDEQGVKHINEYIVVRNLGQGAYGKVKLCLDKRTNKQFAVKVMSQIISKLNLKRKKSSGFNSTALDDVKREIAILKKIQHPNVVQLYEVIDDESDKKMYMVMEYVTQGALMKGTTENTPLTVPTIWQYMRDAVVGLEYLHSQHIIHRDLKPENLLVTSDGHLKISDFGDDELYKTAGSPAFLAPEICAGGKFSGKEIDIWALGVTLYVMIYRKTPFYGQNILQLYNAIKTESLVFPDGIDVDPRCVDLMRRMLVKDPAERITMVELKSDAWLTDDGSQPMVPSEINTAEIVVLAEDEANAVDSKDDSFKLTDISATPEHVSEDERDDGDIAERRHAAAAKKYDRSRRSSCIDTSSNWGLPKSLEVRQGAPMPGLMLDNHSTFRGFNISPSSSVEGISAIRTVGLTPPGSPRKHGLGSVHQLLDEIAEE